MALNWTIEYEAQPRDGSNPGFIAKSVAGLKTAISERMVLEHFFGAAEGTDYGKHREGSARFFVEDDESAGRSDKVTSDTKVGRAQVDLNEMSTQPDVNGVAQTGVLERTISVWDKDGTLQEVYDPEKIINTTWDQNIGGRKVFNVENPEVQEVLDDTTYAAMDAPTKARADEKAVKRSGIKIWTDEAKDHNIFDVTDPDNSINPTADGELNPISGTAETTANNISAQTIYADAIYGAVYA